MPNDAITPFILAVPQADLEDLNRRIDQTRWPDAETVPLRCLGAASAARQGDSRLLRQGAPASAN
jgi:hypothetical protein